MKLKFKNTIEDYYQLGEYLNNIIPMRFLRFRLPYILCPITCIIIICTTYFTNRNIPGIEKGIILVILALTAMNIAFFIFVPKVYRRNLSNQIIRTSKKNKFILNEKLLEVRWDSISLSIDMEKKSIYKDEIYSIIDTKDYIFIFKDKGVIWTIIPKYNVNNDDLSRLSINLNVIHNINTIDR